MNQSFGGRSGWINTYRSEDVPRVGLLYSLKIPGDWDVQIQRTTRFPRVASPAVQRRQIYHTYATDTLPPPHSRRSRAVEVLIARVDLFVRYCGSHCPFRSYVILAIACHHSSSLACVFIPLGVSATLAYATGINRSLWLLPKLSM